MLHGIGAHAEYFRFQLAALSSQWRVIAWNAPGYGLSDNLRSEQPQASDYAQALDDFLQAVQVDRCVLVGNSFGSAVAQAFAIAQPQRVIGLVLTGAGIGQRQLAPARRAAFEERVSRIREGAFQYGDRGLHPDGLQRAAAFRLSSFFSPDHADRLTMPLLMVQGSHDSVNPRQDNADVLLAAVPQARLQLWQGVGHLPEAEAPELFGRTLAQFAQAAAA
jgi:pimeloyl-ACP methyl ester carboxylesterase